jgi:hypothetical protein
MLETARSTALSRIAASPATTSGSEVVAASSNHNTNSRIFLSWVLVYPASFLWYRQLTGSLQYRDGRWGNCLLGTRRRLRLWGNSCSSIRLVQAALEHENFGIQLN